MFAYNPVEFHYLETIAKIFIIFGRKNQFIQETFSTMLQFVALLLQSLQTLRSLDIIPENPFWYQQFDLRQSRRLNGGQPFVAFDAADICRLVVTAMKAMNFQDDIISIPIDNLKGHVVLVFHVTSMQDATEKCHYPELVGEPLKLELNFAFLRERITEIVVLGEEMSSVAAEIFVVVGKNV